MGEEYVDSCPSVEVYNDNARKEKTKIAEVAAATLCRLNNITKQMKDWRDDRIKLRSNIWRLKLALRVAGRETGDTLQADPLMEHQRTELKRLETNNKELKKEIADIKSALLNGGCVTEDASWESNDKLIEVKQEYLVERERLNSEILYLQSRLSEVEGGHEHGSEVDHLKCKLKHFTMVDHTMEIIFTDIINKVAETVANLSEELVNVNERLHRSQLRNDNLYEEVDKLKAMLRFKSGNLTDYQKRIVELDNLTKRLQIELNKFDNSWSTDSNYLKNVERLANELKNKLKNDQEALLAAGDPDCLKYMRKIIDLRVSLKHVHTELIKSNDDLRSSCPEETVEYNKYLQQLSILDTTLNEINVEIDKVKDSRVKKYCRIGDTDGLRYLKKIEGLEAIVEKARATMNGLNRRTGRNSNECKDIGKLKGFVGEACYEIKQLEVIVASSDRLSTFQRIEELEELIVRLKSETREKDEHVTALGEKLFDLEGLLQRRTRELDDAQNKVTVLLEENRILKGKTKRMEEKTLELEREYEDTWKELEELEQVKREAGMTRKKLQNLQLEKDGLLKEIEKVSDALRKRNEEIKAVVTEKDIIEETLNAKITDATKNLQATSKENEKLQSKVNELEQAKCRGREIIERENENAKRSRDASESMKVELQRLKTNLARSKESLDRANREIADLKVKSEHLSGDKTKLETNIFNLESKKEVLMYQLGAEKTTAAERLKKLTKLKSDYNELDVERANLRKEKEQLNAELTSLRIEKELLEKSVEHVRVKCSSLESKIDEYKSERNKLREEIRNFETTEVSLSGELEKTRAELNGAGDEVRRLEFVNSRLCGDLNELTLKNAGFEGRVLVLLAEKDELASRIDALDEENVALKGQLDEAKTTSERLSVESKQLRTECEKAKSENAALQMALDEAEKYNETLSQVSEGLKLKLNEIHSECRIVENQLKILEMMNATLKKEKELLEQEFVNSLRSKITNPAANSESNFGEQNELIVEHVTEKTTNEAKRSNGKSGKRANDKAKDRTKKLMVENESLRFEVLNLKSQNFEIKMQLASVKDQIQKRKFKLSKKGSEIEINPILNKLEVVNVYYKEISSCIERCSSNVSTVTRIDRSNAYPYGVLTVEEETGAEIERLPDILNKLKVENVALKMEVNSLRCNLVVNLTEDEERKNELRNATEEIQALKAELAKLRDEKESLRVRLDTAATKLDRLESEKAALKDELYTLREINSDLKQKGNELRCDYEKLKQRSVGFEGCIMRAIKKIKRYTMSTEDNNSTNDELNILLKKYISSEEVLRSIEQGVNIDGT